MRPLLVLFLGLTALASTSGLGRLVQPDGSVVAIGVEGSTESRTIVFPRLAVPVRSWLLLPEGTLVREAEIVREGERLVLGFPLVRMPGLRVAVEVPAGTLSLTLRGRIPDNPDLIRSLAPPKRDTGPWLARSWDETRVDLPSWRTAEGWTTVLELTRPTSGPWKAVLSDGTAAKTFTFQPSVRQWSFAPGAWGFQPTRLVVTGADPRLAEVRVRAIEASTPLPADPATILAWPPQRWREPRREWFHWSGTSVLVLVSASYQVQDAYLKRLAFYIEKTGFRGRLVTEEEIASLHAWNAHDYAGPDLARFFTHAAQEGLALNSSEVELRDRLVSTGILVAEGAMDWKPGTGALVGISAESAPALRSVLFVHEAFHGLYFTTKPFRTAVKAAWDGLSEASRQAFRGYLALARYDPSDEGLMVNEFQAYVLQRPAVEWEGFFRDRVLARLDAPGRVSLLVELLTAAHQLDAWVDAYFGFPSGEVSTVTPF